MSYYQPTYQMPYRTYYGAQQYQAQPVYQAPPLTVPQDGTIPARLVSGREEAVASNVIPGSMFVFYDRGNGKIYVKAIDPQTGAAEFREFAEISQPHMQQQQSQAVPQYATIEMLARMQQEFDRRIETLTQQTAWKTEAAE